MYNMNKKKVGKITSDCFGIRQMYRRATVLYNRQYKKINISSSIRTLCLSTLLTALNPEPNVTLPGGRNLCVCGNNMHIFIIIQIPQ